MAKDVIMPVLGMNQDTALLVSWLAEEGDSVVEGEPIMEVETDKAVMQLDAPASGVLVNVTAAAGEDVQVGSVIAQVVAEGEAPPPKAAPADAAAPPSDTSSGSGTSDAASEEAPGDPPTSSPPLATTPVAERNGPRTPASPLARWTAEERGLDLDTLPGSGPHGAVLMRDVPEAGAKPATEPASEPSTESAAAPERAAAPQIGAGLAVGTTLGEVERRIDASHLTSMLANAGDVAIEAAIARFLAAVVARRLPEDLTAGVTLDVRGPEGAAHIAHAERRSILDLAGLLAEAGADPGDAGPATALLVHAGDAPLDAVRPHGDAPVSLGLARPGAGDILVMTLRYRPDRVPDALAMTMLADLARLVDEPHVLAVAF